jgi:hypothetical protein
MEDRHATVIEYNLLVCEVVEIMSTCFTNPPSETDVSAQCFLTRFFVDVYKYELYVRITQIINDKFRLHVVENNAMAFHLPMLSGHELLSLQLHRVVLQMLNRKGNGKGKINC